MSALQKTLHCLGHTEFARYFWAGSLAFVTDFAVIVLLTEGVGINYLWSNLAAVSVGMVISYLLCIKWVFVERRYTRVAWEFSLFALTGGLCLVLNEALLWALVEFGQVHYLAAKIVVTLAVFAINFCLKKVLLFSR